MNNSWILAATLVAAALITGCQTIPPGAEPGPNGTIAYEVLVDASAPGAQIEANGQVVGNTPVRLKIFADPDGTFHDFGSYYYVIRALPVETNQYPQVRVLRTGHLFTPEDRVPARIDFDMNQPTSAYPPVSPAYGYPGYGPPAYYYGPPAYYGAPFYGPSFRLYLGPGGHHHHGRW